MAHEAFPVNNLLATAKSREVQRALQAEMRGDRTEAALHFLAAAHMEKVLAADYERAGETDLAWRSQLSAGSSLWRGGQGVQAREVFDTLMQNRPDRTAEVQQIVAELSQAYPALAS